MKYKNNYGEEIFVEYSDYNILTTDNKSYDKIINPFDLNLSKDYPYNDNEKNKSCFLELDFAGDKILLVFKTDELPSFDELYEMYYNYITDTYDIEYTIDLFRGL